MNNAECESAHAGTCGHREQRGRESVWRASIRGDGVTSCVAFLHRRSVNQIKIGNGCSLEVLRFVVLSADRQRRDLWQLRIFWGKVLCVVFMRSLEMLYSFRVHARACTAGFGKLAWQLPLTCLVLGSRRCMCAMGLLSSSASMDIAGSI